MQPGPDQTSLPVSELQRGLLFHQELGKYGGLHVVQTVFHIRGELEPAALRQAWRAVTDRHDILRSTFHDEDTGASCLVSAVADPEWVEQDWSQVPAGAQDESRREFLRRDRERGFRPESAPPTRLTLFRLASEEFVIVWTYHRLLLDPRSETIVIDDLIALYDPEQKTTISQERAPVPSFFQYIDWLNRLPRHEAQLFWASALSEFHPPVRSSPTHHRTESPSPSDVEEETLALSSQAREGLLELSRTANVSLESLFIGAWSLVCRRYQGSDDIVLGTACRDRPGSLDGVEQIVGLVLATFPVRIRFGDDEQLVPWLKRLEGHYQDCLAHSYCGLQTIVTSAEVATATELFDQLIAVDSEATTDRWQTRNQQVEAQRVQTLERTPYSFVLVAALGPAPRINVQFRRSAYRDVSVRRMIEYFGAILDALSSNPNQRLSDLPQLPPGDRDLLLGAWKGVRSDYPRSSSIPTLFDSQVRDQPLRPALALNGQRTSYAQLGQRSDLWARALETVGVRAGDRVGILLDRSTAMIATFLGVLKIGAAYVPLDPAYPPSRLEFLIEDAQIRAIVTQQSLRDRVPLPGRPQLLIEDAIGGDIGAGTTADVGSSGGPVATVPVPAEATAYINYTSGSTGTPKGVEVPHRAVVRLVCSTNYVSITSSDVFLHLSNPSFDATTFEIWAPLLHGATCVVMPEGIPTADEIGRQIRQHGVTILWLTAPLFNAVIDESPETLRGVRQLIIGGEALSVGHVNRGQEALPDTQIINGYGPTEGTTFTCCHRIQAKLRGEATSIPIGRPVSNTEVYVLDEAGSLLPIGAPGELFIGGDGLARGYLSRPAMTSERFIPNPFSTNPCDRLYRTGDRVRFLKDGTLDFLGRFDDQVKIRGFRIEPGEVETALAAHEAIRQVVVLPRRDAQGDRQLVAFVVPWKAGFAKDGGTPVLREFLLDRIPSHMVPTSFVFLDEFPLTPNGKVARRELLSGANGRDTLGQLQAGVAARTDAEEALSKMWAELLGLPQVGIHDDFFALGGHSLLATRVVSRVQSRFGVKLPIRSLFESPTVAHLCEEIEALAASDFHPEIPRIPRVSRDGPHVTSLGQEQLWYLYRLAPESSVYNVPLRVHLRGPLCVATLEVSLNQLIKRHEPLRTRFRMKGSNLLQWIDRNTRYRTEHVDLSHLGGSTRREELNKRIRAESCRPFNLGTDSALRCTLYRLGDREHVLLLTLHHIICDGWSMNILLGQLGEFYRAHLAGREPKLPDLPIQYADYCEWRRRHDGDDTEERQLKYWRTQLEGAPSLLELPFSRPPSKQLSLDGDQVSMTLPASVVESVRDIGTENGTTLFMTLLAAFQALLSRITGETDMVIGSPFAGRRHQETEGLVGFFVNTLPLRADLSGDPPFREVLRRTYNMTLDAYRNQDVPLERIVKELNPERSPNITPLFQIVFVLQNALDTGLSLPALEVGLTYEGTGTAKFDLTLIAEEEAHDLRLTLEYRSDLFDDLMMQQLLESYGEVLEQVVASPYDPVSKLTVRTPQASPSVKRVSTSGCSGTTTEARPRGVGAQAMPGTAADPEVVRRLTEIWKELLDTEQIDPEDDFFHVGGHSLLAIRLFARIESVFGLKLPLATLFQCPTINQLSVVLSGQSERDSSQTLVTIREGGSGPVVYVLPSMGGELFASAGLFGHLPDESPIRGFKLPMVAGRFTTYDSIEQMAARFVDDLVLQQHTGSVCLVGYSFGGPVAYEMARQLVAQGRKPPLVVLIDAEAQGGSSVTTSRSHRIRGILKNLPWWFRGVVFRSSPRMILNYVRMKCLWSGHRVAAGLRIGRGRTSGNDVGGIFDLSTIPPHYVEIMQLNLDIYHSYRPKRYPGSLVLLRGKARPLLHSHRSDLGWSDFAEEVEVRTLPCSHDNILEEPYVFEVARHIAEILQDRPI